VAQFITIEEIEQTEAYTGLDPLNKRKLRNEWFRSFIEPTKVYTGLSGPQQQQLKQRTITTPVVEEAMAAEPRRGTMSQLLYGGKTPKERFEEEVEKARVGAEKFEAIMEADPDVISDATDPVAVQFSRWLKRSARDAYETEIGAALAGAMRTVGLQPPEDMGVTSMPGVKNVAGMVAFAHGWGLWRSLAMKAAVPLFGAKVAPWVAGAAAAVAFPTQRELVKAIQTGEAPDPKVIGSEAALLATIDLATMGAVAAARPAGRQLAKTWRRVFGKQAVEQLKMAGEAAKTNPEVLRRYQQAIKAFTKAERAAFEEGLRTASGGSKEEVRALIEQAIKSPVVTPVKPSPAVAVAGMKVEPKFPLKRKPEAPPEEAVKRLEEFIPEAEAPPAAPPVEPAAPAEPEPAPAAPPPRPVPVEGEPATAKELIANIDKAIETAVKPTKYQVHRKIVATEEKVTLQVPGGTVTIFNDARILEEFKADAKAMFAKPTKAPIKAPKIGVARPKVQWGPACPTEDPEVFADGALLVKGKPPVKALKAVAGPVLGTPTKEATDRMLATPTKPAKFVQYKWKEAGVGEGFSAKPIPTRARMGEEGAPTVVFRSEAGDTEYSQARFLVLDKAHPDATFGVAESGMLVAYKEGEPVGALMNLEGPTVTVKPPAGVEVRGAISDIAPAEMERQAAAGRPEPPPREPVDSDRPPPTTLENVVVDSVRDWPPQIKEVGEDYWTTVMSVARELDIPYRYKAMRQGLLGSFGYQRGVKLQNVKAAQTATHEVGHGIDWLMNNKAYPSSIKKRLPAAEVGEKVLRAELARTSMVMRPDLWENPGRYVKSHVELMADFIAHYVFDPEATLVMAPNMTRAFDQELAKHAHLKSAIDRLRETRYEGPERPVIAERLQEEFGIRGKYSHLRLNQEMSSEGYVKTAEELGIRAARQYKSLLFKAEVQAKRIDDLVSKEMRVLGFRRRVPDIERQTDLMVLAEQGSRNPWTNRTLEDIKKQPLTKQERKALDLYRGYMEEARQTVNKYLRGANIAEYVKFLEDYFIHAYDTPMTQKFRSAIGKWAKTSPQARKRVLPDLAAAVDMGLVPRARTLSEGLRLWAGINFRVATNIALLKALPNVTNDDGISVFQKPKEFPEWPTVDYQPIRQIYARPLKGRGVLLFEGRVAVDPEVKPMVDALFDRPFTSAPVRVVENLNAIWKGFQLTVFSLFHHQAEFFSAAGALGPEITGFWGPKAAAFGQKKLFGFLPERIGVLKAGKDLEKVPEFMADYIEHGGQVGYISSEGRNRIERMLKGAEDFLWHTMMTRPSIKKAIWPLYIPVKATRQAYAWTQHLLWDNVQRAKLVSYYKIVSDGANQTDLPIDDVKEIAAKYVGDNFGGQEWLNTMFRNPKTRQFFTQTMMSHDWTWSQIKTLRWPFMVGGKTPRIRAQRKFMRKIGRHHWFWYLAAIAGFTVAGNYAWKRRGPWVNEMAHRLDIDWTDGWRSLPWNSGAIGRSWEERGDLSRRYIGLGKAGRELVRWVTHPLTAFGYKLSPVARTIFQQSTGYNVGSDFPAPWKREDLEWYDRLYSRFGQLMKNFKPFAFSGNNAFLAFPSRKGMTHWKATKAFADVFRAKAAIAYGGIPKAWTQARMIATDEERLIQEIREAAVANGVDAEKAARAGLADTRSSYYRQFWHACRKGRVEQANRYAKSLEALGATQEGLERSFQARREQISPEAIETAREALKQ